MKYRFCRTALALILVLLLLISWSPIRAQASALPEVAGVVTKVIPFAKVVEPAALGVGGSIFCWVALGLGVLFTASQAVQAYNDYQDFTGDLETSIYYYPDGSWSYGVDMGFVERVRAFLFESNIVVPISNIPTSSRYSERANTAITSAASKPFALLADDGSVNPIIFYSSAPLLVDSNLCYTVDGTPLYWFHESASYDWVLANGGKKYFNKGSSLIYFGTNSPSYGLSDGTVLPIAPLEVPVPEGYPEWHTNARPAVNPDTQEEITILPIPLNPSADPETQIGTLTQPDIWQGTIADPMPEPDPDPNPDPGTDNEPWQDWFTPSGDPGQYGIQLRDFFPFCIPFDLYDFLSCLAADPVAPVFHWEIPVPQLGRTFEVDVDLSAWDPVAELFRRLELLAFIVGLAYVTREKYLRG